MKKTITLFFFIALLANTAQSQVNCAGGRYIDSLFSVDTIHNVLYGQNINYDGTTRQLQMDIYLPHGDTAQHRPLIIFAPKGSFLQEDKGELTMRTLCRKFAELGYVTAAIDYRVGVDYMTAYTYPQREFTYAVMRAVHDYKAAIRFFRKDAATTNSYKINPNLIIAGGSSAGAITALHVAYLDKASEVPTVIDTTGLGGLEGLSGNPGYPTTVNYVVNLCGAIQDSSWIEPGNIPLISMHGNLDTEVPYGTATISMIVPIMQVDGSASINIRCNHIGIDNPFHTFWGQQHIPYDTNAGGAYLQYMDTTITFVRNHLYNWICGGSAAINEIKSNDVSVVVSPNPFSDYTIISTISEFQNAIFFLFSIAGNEIMRRENISGDHFRLNKNELANGIYFYRIIGDNGQFTNGKIIIN